MHARVVRLALLLSLSASALAPACGGKILEEPGTERAARGDRSEPRAPPSAANDPAAVAATEPSPEPLDLERSCERICARDAACGAYRIDCLARCHARAGDGCGGEAWLRCYAERIVGCAALPPACEPAHCAWAICAGEPVPDYCR